VDDLPRIPKSKSRRRWRCFLHLFHPQVAAVTHLAVRELPLFPLPDVVLFPQEVLPLHIFEPRYRMMLRSVLETDRRFGVVRWDPQTKTMATVGCCAEILQCQSQDDDRSNIVTLGQQRFRVLEVVREAPFRVAMVSWIEDETPASHQLLTDLAADVTKALKDVVDLTGKLVGKTTSLPSDLPDLPRELSFWIGSHLGGPVADQQQTLLEITDTGERLRLEYDLLDQTRRQLAARTVLKDTFQQFGEEAGSPARDNLANDLANDLGDDFSDGQSDGLGDGVGADEDWNR
jgi:ATP-dependent Lon protease